MPTKTSPVVWVAGIAIVIVATMPWWRDFVQKRPVYYRIPCVSNIKSLSLAMIMYSADNDDRLPPAANWSDLLGQYVKNHEVTRCPSAKVGGYYALHSSAAEVNVKKVKDPQLRAMLFESDSTSPNPSGGFEILPAKSWHGDQFAVSFLDGHAAFRTRDRILAEVRTK